VGRNTPSHIGLYRAKDDYTVTRYSALQVRGQGHVRLSTGISEELRCRSCHSCRSAVRSWDKGIRYRTPPFRMPAMARDYFGGRATQC